MDKFFSDRIIAMKTHFNLVDDICSYWSLLMTINIGRIELYLFEQEHFHLSENIMDPMNLTELMIKSVRSNIV